MLFKRWIGFLGLCLRVVVFYAKIVPGIVNGLLEFTPPSHKTEQHIDPLVDIVLFSYIAHRCDFRTLRIQYAYVNKVP